MTGIGKMVRMGFVLLLVLTGLSPAAPFAKRFDCRQPDGTSITLWGQGDEFSAVFETLDGYTVVYDHGVRGYCYARLTAAQDDVISAGMLVRQGQPPPAGLVKHLRVTPQVRGRAARLRAAQWDRDMGISVRWAATKKAVRAAAQSAGGTDGGALRLPPSSPTTGFRQGLTLLVDFSDDPATVPRSEFANFLNGESYAGYGNNGSVRQYFLDNSNGLLDYSNIVVAAYIRVPRPKSFYNDTSHDYGTQGRLLVTDAINAMKALPDYTTTFLPTFSGLTVNAAGLVVACNVLFAGNNSGVWTYGLWPGSMRLASPLDLGNAKKVFCFQITNIGAALELGTFCHENGHMLCGFPDIYAYDDASMGGAGSFCLMDYGCFGGNPAQICAYLKRAAGWATTIDLTSTSRLTANVVASGPGFNRFYRCQKPGVATEYFLIENRQRAGRDAGLPASGVAVWHVDEFGDNSDQSLAPNDTNGNYEVTLVQADNRWDFENNANAGDAQDLYYDGNTAAGYANRLTDASAPAAHWWDGTSSGLNIHDFSASGANMTFVVDPTPETPRSGEGAGIVTSPRGTFTIDTMGNQFTEIRVCVGVSADGADLHLIYTGDRATGGLPAHSFGTEFEGAWMPIGNAAGAMTTYGKIFRLNKATSSSDGISWEFGHTLPAGGSGGVYQRDAQGKWVQTHVITCR